MDSIESLRMAIDSTWVAVGAGLVFIMNLGFALLESGYCRSKNTVNILTKNIAVFGLTLIVYWSLGFAIEFGNGNDFLGTSGFFLLGEDNSPLSGQKYSGVYSSLSSTGIPLELKFLFQAGFAATAATIVSGAVAERIKLIDFLLFVLLFVPFGYAIVTHWVWGGGWLYKMGFYDFAGSTLVHVAGGAAALVGAKLLGARTAKYGKFSAPLLGHSATSRVIGCGILWIGWWGFNGASTGAAIPAVSHVLLATNLAAAAGGLAAFSFVWWRYNRPDLSVMLDGILGGLVAITASCAYVSIFSSAFIGAFAGILVALLSRWIDEKLKIDDPCNAIAVHLGAGTWGTIALGLYSEGSAFGMQPAPAIGLLAGGDSKQLGVQLVGFVCVFLFTSIVSLLLWTCLKITLGLRVSEKAEYVGLDVASHREAAYPEFAIKERGDA